LRRKVENSFYDFKFEEDLIKDTLQKSTHSDFARINTLFDLGHAFYKANDVIKMESVFNLIQTEKHDLSPSTVANFYRSIGEIYIELAQTDKALDWLRAGLTLNPKLGVKKLIDKLEKK
jgi:hypothetical protein